jgi:hypothetical protein
MSNTGMRCKKHPSAEPGGGICSVCLRERLAKIAQEENIAAQHALNNVYLQERPPANLEEPAHFNHLHEALRRQATLESFMPRCNSVAVDGKSRRSRRSSTLLSLFRNVDQDSNATNMADSGQKWKINSRGRSGEDKEGFISQFGFSKKEDLFLKDEDKFICMDFEEPKESSTSWFSSFLQRWSKRKQSSQRNSFSGRPSFESSRHSLDKILSKKSSSYYERELARRQQVLKAGGWEVQLQSPVDHQQARRCRECDGHEEEMEMDYYSDSCSVLRKHKTALPLSNLFRKASLPGTSTHSAHACKDKKNARVANCILSAKNPIDMRAEVSEVDCSGKRVPAKSPIWKPSRSCSTKDAGRLCAGSSSFLMKRSPGHLCSMVNSNHPSNYSFFLSPHRLPPTGSQCSSRGPNGKLN